MNRQLLAATALVAVVAGSAGWALDRPPVIEVPAGADARTALRRAPAGAVVVLGRGEHEGPLTIRRAVTLRGEPGAAVVADSDAPAVVMVRADGATLEDITTYGGSSGVVVREVTGVRLDSVRVRDADLHGIEVIDASAHISGVGVGGLRHDLAQGVEVRNSDGRPDTIVESSTVVGGMEGIVSHVSEVEIRDNVVRDTSMRGITVTEMSDGVVSGNTVEGATGAGLYCGDMSRCQFQDNTVGYVAGNDDGRSTAGWGLVVTYHAAASTENDALEGAAGPSLASIGGRFTQRSPLERGAGLQAAVPAALASAAGIGLLVLLYLGLRPAAAALGRTGVAGAVRRAPTWLLSLGLLGLGVQTFHMFEHSLQLYRVRVDGIPSRGGVVGPGVESEWIHFIYNAAVLVGFVLVVTARRRGWRPPGHEQIGDRMLLAGALLQGYHAIEHSVKLAQHVASGVKVAPGILGGEIDLVLLHFSINLGVYLAAAGAFVAYLWGVHMKERVEPSALRYG